MHLCPQLRCRGSKDNYALENTSYAKFSFHITLPTKVTEPNSTCHLENIFDNGAIIMKSLTNSPVNHMRINNYKIIQ